MEKEDIISSGLLELYAAGIASQDEAVQVEQWVVQYPEVAAELDKISAAAETYAKAFAIEPAADIKGKILSRIQVNTGEKNKVIPIIPAAPGTSKTADVNMFWKIAAAASVVLLIGSIALNIVTYNKFNAAGRSLAVAEQTLGDLQAKNKEMEDGMSVVQSKYSIPVALSGQAPAPEAVAKVFYMKNTGEVYLDPSNLPEAPQGKQYQFWGIVDGKPVSGGMILTNSKGDKFRIQKMKSFGKVEAFAVSLENETGNTSPKGPIYVMGKL